MASVFLSSKLWGAVSMALALVAFQASSSRAEGDVRPTPHELAAIEARGGPRLWYHEEEFRHHSRLRAEPHQVVVLHLEPADRSRKPIRNTVADHLESGRQGRRPIRNIIPYRFAKTAVYSFCIPKDEPHIRSIELRREGWHGVEVHVTRNSPCKTRTIAAGRYQLQVEHDGSRIGPAGEKAFIHIPRAQSSFPSCSDVSVRSSENIQVLFAAPNGSYVVENDDSHKVVTSTAFEDDPYWVICHDDGGNYQVLQPTGGPPQVFFSAGPPSTDTTLYALQEGPTTVPTAFKLTDLGNGQFTLAANFAGTLYPIILGIDGALHWTTSGTPATFTIVLTHYPPGVAAQPLQPGEVALFQACNYVSSQGTWVFNTSISDFGPFTVGGSVLDNTVASAKVGPQTTATLYANAGFGGTSQLIGADTPCLNGTPLGSNAASSLRIVPARQFVASTGSCQYCNLTGVDLSNLDLTGGSFQGSTLTGANLSDANLQSAILDQAKFRSYSADGGPTILNGTDFLGAHLHCTDFQASDLRQAFFVSSGTPPVLPVITKDFSCRLQLQHADLNLNTFPVSDWRYFSLNDASIANASGQVLSSASNPLDLSHAQLSGTTGLTQVDLTAANIAGADFSGTDLTGANLSKVTSIDPVTQTNVAAAFIGATLDGAKFDYAILNGAHLTDASLLNASLIRVSLGNALLQGAFLSSANLDGANLGAAQLNHSPSTFISANLEGAFLRNVNFSRADLTGVFLNNSNFYSSAPTSSATCTPDSSGFTGTCASASGAQLDNTVFSGAYLAGVDFSGAFAQAASFDGAFLMGSNFSGETDLSVDSSQGTPVTFANAYLQGVNFSTANVTGATFKNAVVDLVNTNGQTLRIQLDLTTHPLTFTGYTPHADSDLGCVQFSTARKTTLPSQSYSISMCPDGKRPDGTAGESCSQNQWTAVPQPVSSSCNRDSNWTSTSGIY